MSKFAEMLASVWGLHNDPVLAEAKKAVKVGDNDTIQACIAKFEAMLVDGGAQPYELKENAWKTEVESKIAVLKAILSGEAADWQTAHDTYANLAETMSSLARSCCSCEDVAQIMFQSDRDNAVRLANLCLAQIEGKQDEATRKQFIHDAEELITRVGPSLGCGDFTYGPELPEGRDDIAAVKRMAENGRDYGYDTIYLVWKSANGSLKYRVLTDSRSTKDYLHVMKISIEGEEVIVEVSKHGTFRVPLANLN